MDFLNEVKTLEDRDLLLSEIESIRRKDFSAVREKYLEQLVNSDMTDLSKKLNEIEVVRIVLAIQPTKGIIEMIDDFFMKNIQKKILIDLNIQKEIIGGIQMVYKGKYFDMSVQERLEKI